MQRLGSGGPTSASRIRAVGLLLLAAHLCLVGWLALRPLAVPWVTPTNLHPLATIRSDLADGAWTAVRNLAPGLLLLAPFGVLLPLATGRLHRALPGTVARTTFAGAMVSVGVTLVQAGVPGHVVDVDTVLLNTAGVALAAGLVFPTVRRRLRFRDGSWDAGGVGSGGPAHHPGRTGGAGRTDGDRVQRSRPGGEGRVRLRGEGGVRLREEASQGSTPRRTRVGTAP